MEAAREKRPLLAGVNLEPHVVTSDVLHVHQGRLLLVRVVHLCVCVFGGSQSNPDGRAG